MSIDGTANLHEADVVAQISKNKEAFTAVRQNMESKHWGKVVLMHDGAVVAIYNDDGDAYAIGCEKFGLGHFSIHRVGQQPVDFGIHSIMLQPRE